MSKLLEQVEHIYREQNIMAAYEIIELFCELIVVRLPIIDSQRLEFTHTHLFISPNVLKILLSP